MSWSINLRGDLAKLSDAELSERLEQAWIAYRSAEYTSPFKGEIWYSRRGPIRHRWAYRLFSLLGVSGAGGHFLGFGLFFRIGYMEMHLYLCEIRDIQDEIARRVEVGKRQSA